MTSLRPAVAGGPRGASADVVQALAANHARFLAFLRRRVRSEADAEDILQSAFVRGLEKADSLRDGESATAWFFRLLRNAVVDHYRHHAVRRRAAEQLLTDPTLDPAFDRDLEEVVCACVADLAATLKPDYAGALRRVELEGASLKDYASEAGITPGNAAVRVHRARVALRRRVEESCGTCASCGTRGPSACTCCPPSDPAQLQRP